MSANSSATPLVVVVVVVVVCAFTASPFACSDPRPTQPAAPPATSTGSNRAATPFTSTAATASSTPEAVQPATRVAVGCANPTNPRRITLPREQSTRLDGDRGAAFIGTTEVHPADGDSMMIVKVEITHNRGTVTWQPSADDHTYAPVAGLCLKLVSLGDNHVVIEVATGSAPP